MEEQELAEITQKELNSPDPFGETKITDAGMTTWQRGLAKAVNDTYNFSNSSLYIGMLPAYYRDYAWRYLRQAICWLDGYVPELHQGGESGIMSTRIASSLIAGYTKQVVGEKLIFKPNDKEFDEKAKAALQKISKWAIQNNIIKSVYAGIGFSLGLGTSLLKINISNFNVPWWEAVRMDNCFYFADFKNEVREATFLIKSYIDTEIMKRNEDGGKDQFYLVEHRFYKTWTKRDKLLEKQPDGSIKVLHKVGEQTPMVEYQVYRVHGTTMNNTMPTITSSNTLNWENIPTKIRKMIKENYSAVRVNEPQELGLVDLGVYPLLNGNIDLGIPTGSNFGESKLVPIQSDLITYEVAESYLLRDMYLGKGTVYVPKSLNISDITGMGNEGVLTGLGESKIEKISGIDPEKNSIVVQQFDIRADEWQKIKENALKSIAVKWGMSVKVLASFLANGAAQMTATQVDSEDDLSVATIVHTRAYFEAAINKALETTLNFMGIENNFKITFASPSLLNKDRLLNRITQELDAGLIDIEDAIRELNPDLDEEALQLKIEKAKANQQAMMMQQLTEMNSAGGFLPGEDETTDVA